MSAISGTRRAMKEMADGTIRVQIDIDPACRAQFLALFPNIDMPVALAPLVADFERREPELTEKPKGGELAKLAGMFCRDLDFLRFLSERTPSNAPVQRMADAAKTICAVCGIESRAELDHNPAAAEMFHNEFRLPFVRWKQGVTA
jgi:hypothetical protein